MRRWGTAPARDLVGVLGGIGAAALAASSVLQIADCCRSRSAIHGCVVAPRQLQGKEPKYCDGRDKHAPEPHFYQAGVATKFVPGGVADILSERRHRDFGDVKEADRGTLGGDGVARSFCVMLDQDLIVPRGGKESDGPSFGGQLSAEGNRAVVALLDS